MSSLHLADRQIRNRFVHPPCQVIREHEVLGRLHKEAGLFDAVTLGSGKVYFVFVVGSAGAVPVSWTFEAGFEELLSIVSEFLERGGVLVHQTGQEKL